MSWRLLLLGLMGSSGEVALGREVGRACVWVEVLMGVCRGCA